MADKNTLMLALALVLIIGAIYYIESTKLQVPQSPGSLQAQAGNSKYPLAPELAGITGYINTPENTTLESLRGKVVLLDFWTYSCINCIRTLPYLESWQEKYGKDGFVVLGVHSPEFDFEKDINNVRAAVEKFGLTYPVVLDSNHATWAAYGNQYWPHHYLIDAQGRIRYDHIGEGGYAETEAQIVQLLSEAKNSTVSMNSSAPNATSVDFRQIATPEIYFGNAFRRAPLGNANPVFDGQAFNATIPASGLQPNTPYLEGEWIANSDSIQLASQSGSIVLQFTAKNANIVAGSKGGSKVSVSIDGKPVESQPSADAPEGKFLVSGMRLYNAAALPDYGTHTLRIDVDGSGFDMFTFTFG
ncbi:MAG: thioredoxin family protein [Candidatus Micrarchaeia archaeon]